MVERPAKRKGFEGLMRDLESHHQTFPKHLQECGENEQNRKKLRHVIGIERWGQNRLRVALGQAYQHDEYHGYKPDKSLSWEALIQSYEKTRSTTLDLAKQIHASTGVEIKVEHNQWGSLTTRGWLQYLETHARLEGQRIKASS